MDPEARDRIAALEEIQAIRRLKARYWRSLDYRRFDELGQCFAEDGMIDVPENNFTLRGPQQISEVMPQALAGMVTVHQGHNEDIAITGPGTATGRWTLHDILYHSATGVKSVGWGFYEDDFVKVDGEWKIKTVRLKRPFPMEVRQKGQEVGS